MSNPPTKRSQPTMNPGLKSLHRPCWKINPLSSPAPMKWTKPNCWLVEAFIVYPITNRFKFQITWVTVWTKALRTPMKRVTPTKKVPTSSPTASRIPLNSRQEIDNLTTRWVSAGRVPGPLTPTKSKIRCPSPKRLNLMKTLMNSQFQKICIVHLNLTNSATVFKPLRRKPRTP